ncbi:MAG: outer membrane lipoprotein carrier protein LolA [Bacteroidales bacterium]|nr:outer membrane lipoprotein carrier protein LolA [Bacteroidales bacterium]
MKRLGIVLAALFSFIALSQAQSANKMATTILKEVSEKTKSYNSIKIEFTYRMENEAANISDSFNGVLLAQGDKYRLDIAGQTIISNGETLWTYLKDAREVQVNNAQAGEGSIAPTQLLDTYDKDFKSKLIDETTYKGRQVQVIELKPKEDQPFEKAEITIDKGKKQVLSLSVNDQSNSVYTYQVNSFKPNVNVSEDDFTFNKEKHPDVDVIDMR